MTARLGRQVPHPRPYTGQALAEPIIPRLCHPHPQGGDASHPAPPTQLSEAPHLPAPGAPSLSQEDLICRDVKTSEHSSKAAHTAHGACQERKTKKADAWAPEDVSPVCNGRQGLGRLWKQQNFPGSQHRQSPREDGPQMPRIPTGGWHDTILV